MMVAFTLSPKARDLLVLSREYGNALYRAYIGTVFPYLGCC